MPSRLTRTLPLTSTKQTDVSESRHIFLCEKKSEDHLRLLWLDGKVSALEYPAKSLAPNPKCLPRGRPSHHRFLLLLLLLLLLRWTHPPDPPWNETPLLFSPPVHRRRREVHSSFALAEGSAAAPLAIGLPPKRPARGLAGSFLLAPLREEDASA